MFLDRSPNCVTWFSASEVITWLVLAWHSYNFIYFISIKCPPSVCMCILYPNMELCRLLWKTITYHTSLTWLVTKIYFVYVQRKWKSTYVFFAYTKEVVIIIKCMFVAIDIFYDDLVRNLAFLKLFVCIHCVGKYLFMVRSMNKVYKIIMSTSFLWKKNEI